MHGYDLKILCLVLLAFAYWPLGYPDKALATAREAVAWAKRRSLPLDIFNALSWLAGVHHFRGERDAAHEVCSELIQVTEDYGAPNFAAIGFILRSWAKSEVAEAENVLAVLEQFGQEMAMPYFHSTLAESDLASGNLDNAIKRLDTCIERAERNKETYYLARLYQLKGESLWRRRGSGDWEAAEACFQQSLTIARSQSAKAYELHTTHSLFHLYAEKGRGDEVRGQLETLYDWFNEGQDIPLLRKVRADIHATGA